MIRHISYYFDQNVAQPVAEGLKRRGVEVVTAQESGLCGATDEEQLEFASKKRYVLFTHDKDFVILHSKGKTHSGIVYIKQGRSVGDLIRGLIMLYDLLTPEEMENHIEFLK